MSGLRTEVLELEWEQDPEPAEKTEELRREKEQLREPKWLCTGPPHDRSIANAFHQGS